MLSPVSILPIFCAAMVVISMGRLLLAEETDPVDAGTVIIVVGITLLSVLWAAVDSSAAAPVLQVILGVVGTGLVGAGVVVVARYWDA